MRASFLFASWSIILVGTLAACGDSEDSSAAAESTDGCTTPATLSPPNTTGPRFIVRLAEATTLPDDRITAIESKFGITATRLPSIKGFAADLTPTQVASIRCEADVASIEADSAVPTG